ncbi:hypothetical protein RB195_022071 [Necator americanus]|uniref:Endonuclease/exonuclease/phosphatase domain-containing protein n=1 Tax=Necator americanus TaxID=51031 RepID=A0ABR1EEW1_NECAM
MYCGDADENKVGGCAIAVRNDYKNLVEEFGSTSSRCASVQTAEDNKKDAFYDEPNALMSKILSQRVVIAGIDANANAERASDNGDRLVDLCKQTGLFIASTYNRNRRHQLRWQGLQLDYVLARNILQSDIQKSRAAWNVVFDSDHRPVLLSFKIRFHKRNRGVPLQPKIDMAGLKDDECRTKFRQGLFMLKHGPGRSLAMLIPSQSASRTLQRKPFRFYSCGRSLPSHLRQENPRTILYVLPVALATSTRKRAGALLKQYNGKKKRCSPVLNTANGVAVGEAALPTWRDHFKTLLNRQAPSPHELERS